jgi:transcription elongation GreA/GreB family factor
MNDNHLQELLEQNKLDELEDYWLEQLEKESFDLNDFLQVAKHLGRHREKARAGVLMTFLDDHLRQHERWKDRLRVLKEITRHTLELKHLDEMKDQLRDTLLSIYAGRPTFQAILKHFSFDEIRNSEELVLAVEKSEEALLYDIGQAFYQQGYGAGKVKEVNLKLRKARIDFDKREDVTVEFGDPEVLHLDHGHVLFEKLNDSEKLKDEDPGVLLGRLLQTFGRAMAVNEIKDCLNGVVSSDQWNRWWNAAKRNPQVIASGKGAQAQYSWSDSAVEAEEALKKEFDGSKIADRISLAKTHASRGGALASHFLQVLLQDASSVFAAREMGLALELLDLFGRWPVKVEIDPGFNFEQVLREADPKSLLASIENQQMKLQVLNAYREIYPDRWRAIFIDHFYQEEIPKIHSYIYDALKNASAESAESILNRLAATPYLHPPGFAWMSEMASAEGIDLENDPFGRRLDMKFLLAVLEALDAPEFSKQRNRLKKALESGLFMNILARPVNTDHAQKAIDMLDHTRYLEDYRRDRWKNVIRMRIPDLKKKEDWIFSTKDAFERKRSELEHLIKVELPLNRKAVGEAAAHGDLKENHEYKAARERQDYLINRVSQLQAELGRVRILEPGQIDCNEVRPGTRVVLAGPEKRMELTLLGPWDSDPQQGIYSYQAPVGTILLGKTPGEKVFWNDQQWLIESILPWA